MPESLTSKALMISFTHIFNNTTAGVSFTGLEYWNEVFSFLGQVSVFMIKMNSIVDK